MNVIPPAAAQTTRHARSGSRAAACRVAWAGVSWLSVESLIMGLAVAPSVLLWNLLAPVTQRWGVLGPLVLGAGVLPAYLLFSLALMGCSALAVRALRWQAPADAEMVIAAYEWPLLCWARQMAVVHVVRVLTGTVFRATPIWTAYLRLSGATIGRHVYVNSLTVNDYQLLEIGDRTVVGDAVHLSGHTVERGVVKTARVRLGRDVVVGVGSIVGIGVEAGDGCQIGALSLVPKFTALAPRTTYVGVPVHPLDVSSPVRPDGPGAARIA